MALKGLIVVILLTVCLIYMTKSVIRLFKRSSSNNATNQNKQLFGGMTKEQKYAFLYSIEIFHTFANNLSQDNDWYSKHESERVNLYLDNILDRCLSLLSMTHDDEVDAISYMDKSLNNPQFYLKDIDYRIKDALLFYCYKIVETKKGNYNGEDINKHAKDFLYDYFGELGYTPDGIEETIKEIKKW